MPGCGGFLFYPGEDCTTADCGELPGNDDCDTALYADPPLYDLTYCLSGGACTGVANRVAFSNVCAWTDGPDPECHTDFGADIWYELHTGSGVCGWLTVDACTNGTYDGIGAIYYQGSSTCVCPPDASETVSCGDDTCGVGGGMPLVPPDGTTPPTPGQGLYLYNNKCYLLRMGGWAGAYGRGEMDISFLQDPDGCG